jgi:hypothetical protein
MTMVASIAFYVVPVQLSFVLNSRGLATPESIGFSSAIANLGVPLGSFLFQALARQSARQPLFRAFLSPIPSLLLRHD